MTPKPIAFLATAAVVPLTALAVMGCGSGGGNNATAANSPPTHPTMVKVSNTGLGKILVDSRGRTLYLFTKDSGSTSTCTGGCASAWPPLLAHGKTTVGGGVNASLVKTTTRSNGAAQVTYNGHPLYRFVQDQSPGDTNGEGLSAFGGTWFAVSPTGNRVSSTSSKSGSGSASPQPAAPAAPPAPPAQKPAAPPAPQPAPKAQPKPNPIPQNGGGDDDADNHGGPDDGDGGI